jgi:hypothetical protein
MQSSLKAVNLRKGDFGNNLVTTLAMRGQHDYDATHERQFRNRLFFKGNQHHRNAFPMWPNARRASFRS